MSNARNTERWEAAYEMRRRGMTMREIAEVFGVSEGRAEQMVKMWKQELLKREIEGEGSYEC